MKPDPQPLSTRGAQACAGLLASGLRVRVEVTGTSMAPLLMPGDVVHLAPTARSRLRRGELLFIQDPRRGFYLHRLLRRPNINGRTMFQTRGDAHRRLDDPVSAGQILARVTAIEHHPEKPWHWRLLIDAPRLLALVALAQSARHYLPRRLRRQFLRC